MSINLNLTQIIAYVIYLIVTGLAAFIATQVKKMREDKNSYYSRMATFADKQEEALKQKMGQEEYNHAKQQAQDIIYKIEQLGKELAWDATTKHAKAAEEIAAKVTGLSDEQIYDIIKTTMGYINAGKNKAGTNLTTSLVPDPIQTPTDNTQTKQNASTNAEAPSAGQTAPGASN